ncbi:hypothetical protein AMQ84_27075 [Paenibacillus riograndensis]|uniref:Uncharacterized protein n=1 Tax=Paenibacillus riograndensis TaxID=483937 RepID=A0A132TJS5_9BACL|nr:hypothetical protein [Paenibacillus riograndensis]KWX71589.1 hypothetical protein AMQ84_27075 [Paenibacillus riograndensis]
MTDLIQEVKAALQAATPGKWQAEGKEIWRRTDEHGAEFYAGAVWITDVEHSGNRELIANAPTWLQQLIDRLETAERQREEAVKALEKTKMYLFSEPSYADELLKEVEATLKRIKGEVQAEGDQPAE